MSVLQQMMPHPPCALLRAGPRMRNFPGCSTQASGIRDGTDRALVSMEMNLGLLGGGWWAGEEGIVNYQLPPIATFQV